MQLTEMQDKPIILNIGDLQEIKLHSPSLDASILNSPSSHHRLQASFTSSKLDDSSASDTSVSFKNISENEALVHDDSGVDSDEKSPMSVLDVTLLQRFELTKQANSNKNIDLQSLLGRECDCGVGQDGQFETKKPPSSRLLHCKMLSHLHPLTGYLRPWLAWTVRVSQVMYNVSCIILPLLWILVGITWFIHFREDQRHTYEQMLNEYIQKNAMKVAAEMETSNETTSSHNHFHIEHLKPYYSPRCISKSTALTVTCVAFTCTAIFAFVLIIKSHWSYTLELMPNSASGGDGTCSDGVTDEEFIQMERDVYADLAREYCPDASDTEEEDEDEDDDDYYSDSALTSNPVRIQVDSARKQRPEKHISELTNREHAQQNAPQAPEQSTEELVLVPGHLSSGGGGHTTLVA